jgi:16S rRNA (uracil1498-N3)-methyltransferase
VNHILLDDPLSPEAKTESEPGGEGGVVLTGRSAHHLGRVLRVRASEEVSVSDGHGGLYRGRVEAVAREQVRLRLRLVAQEPPPQPRWRVLVPVLTGERMRWAVEKLVELGANAIEAVECYRTRRASPGHPAPAERALIGGRLKAVAWAAAEQSRRAWLPEVSGPRPLADALLAGTGPVLAADLRADVPLSAALARLPTSFAPRPATPTEGPGPAALPPAPAASTADPRPVITLVTGPEGGFDDRDRAVLAGCGATRVTLGAGVLRAETAPLVLLTACALHHGKLDEEPSEWLG